MALIASRLDPWAPPIALMALIFALSAQPNLNSGLGAIDLIGRKLVHMSEYALLCLLWWRALRTVMRPARALTLAFAISFAYACSDEIHQLSVEGRHGSPVDVGIDTLGAGIAALAIRRRTA